MLCAQCLLFNDEVPAVTQVEGIAVCADHARAMLRGAPVRPLQPAKLRDEVPTDVAPAPVNTNPKWETTG